MKVRFNHSRAQAEKLAAELGFTSPPVDPVRVAKSLRIPVLTEDLGAEISGVLVSSPKQTSIIVHCDHFPNRQRFSIAHELGHYCLGHQFSEHVHVDRGHFVAYRGPRASEGVDPLEVEANQFAAALLMPSTLVLEAVRELGGPPLYDHHVPQLATRFDVREQAMTIRLGTLGLL